MRTLKTFEHGGVHYDLPEEQTRRERHAENVENRNVKRWQRRYRNYVNRNPEKKGDHAAELYATKPWLDKDKRRNWLGDALGKITGGIFKRDEVTGGVDYECKNPSHSH